MYVYDAIESIKRLAKDVYFRSRMRSSLDSKELKDQAEELKKVFTAFCIHMVNYYNEVERNNTPIYATWGEVSPLAVLII